MSMIELVSLRLFGAKILNPCTNFVQSEDINRLLRDIRLWGLQSV
jgi:hypothetical protein